MRKNGQYLQADYFDNTGGLNISDSPWRVKDTQATGGQNYEYTLTGGIRKIKGNSSVNSVADTALRSVGLSQRVTSDGVKTAIRAADRKLQLVSLTVPSFTNLTLDTAGASSDILGAANTLPTVFSQFNNITANVLWVASGGVGLPVGVYSNTKVTQNGVVAPTGAITATRSALGSGVWASTGTYYWGVSYLKSSTGAESNVALDNAATVTVTTDKVTLDFTGLTGLDTTRISSIKLYRSAVGGTTLFTTGNLVTTLASTTTTYDDIGTSTLSNQNVPRANSTILDNSPLPSGSVCNTLCVWKRRLVTTSGSTVYISDVNKPESWPTANYIGIPSGGPITSASIISFTTPTSQSIDEILVLHKERELWVVTGSSVSDFTLKFIDNTGCINQPLVVSANGYLTWIDYRGIYLWDGSDKPIYCSRPIEPFFNESDQLDKTKFNIGFGFFKRATSEIVWVMSDTINGENKMRIKMDLRLTIPNVQKELAERVMDATFLTDVLNTALYAGTSIVPTTEEVWLVGDLSGFIYYAYNSLTDGSNSVDFQYESKFFDFEMINTAKRYHKLIVWCEDTSDSNITLDYWTKYNSGEDSKTTLSQPISQQVSESLWDLAYWDAAYWDNSIKSYNPIVFNLSSTNNSSEGDCIKFRFTQSDSNAPCTIVGFSVLFTEMGLRK